MYILKYTLTVHKHIVFVSLLTLIKKKKKTTKVVEHKMVFFSSLPHTLYGPHTKPSQHHTFYPKYIESSYTQLVQPHQQLIGLD